MNGTGREGFIDRNSVAVFSGDSIQPPGKDIAKGRVNMADGKVDDDGGDAKEYMATDSELRRMASDNPFVKEAAKILSGKLDEDDASKRRVILNYCEHLRTAYTTKDIDFLKQLFSEQALIIVGNVVKPRPTDDSRYMPEERVKYFIRTKREYIARLEKAFNTNSKIDLKFSDFHIMRHPTMNGIYGVTLRQRYESDNYSDDGYLFLLWDFRNKLMPLIHVRTWQPANTIGKEDEVISISDFNLE